VIQKSLEILYFVRRIYLTQVSLKLKDIPENLRGWTVPYTSVFRVTHHYLCTVYHQRTANITLEDKITVFNYTLALFQSVRLCVQMSLGRRCIESQTPQKDPNINRNESHFKRQRSVSWSTICGREGTSCKNLMPT